MRDLLANNQIAYHWLDVEEPARADAREASLGTDRLPVVLPPDAEPLVGPDPAEVASAIGLQTQEELAYYDLVVVGAGPAGLAAAVYGASGGPPHRRRRAADVRRPGGNELADRELPRLSRRAVRRGPRPPRDSAGTPFPRRAADRPGGGRHRRRRHDPRRAARGRHRDRSHTVLLAPGRLVPAARRQGRRATHRTGHLVRHGVRRRRRAARRPGSVRHRRGELGRAGRAPPRQRDARDDPLSRREPPEVDVAVPRRPHRGDARGDHVRVRAEVRETHGEEQLESITIDEGGDVSRVPATAMFVFVGAEPHTDWLGTRRPAPSAASSSPASRCSTCPGLRALAAENGIRSRSRRASPASSPPATCATSRSSAWPPRSARGRWPCCSSTSTSRTREPGSRRAPPDHDPRRPPRRAARRARAPRQRADLEVGEYLFREDEEATFLVAAARGRARDDASSRR